jgi:lysophospholipase L1-like esterase
MKPIQSLVFLLAILGTVASLPFFSGTETVRFGAISVKLWHPNSLLFKNEPLSVPYYTAPADSSRYVEVVSLHFPVQDSSQQAQEAPPQIIQASRSFSSQSLRHKAFPIEYPAGDSSVLFSFFRMLDNISESPQPLRILHYGDSQIEGGRISSVIRQELQSEFGGLGPGFMPVYAGQSNIGQWKSSYTGNWYIERVFGQSGAVPVHNRYGILGSYSGFMRDTALPQTVAAAASVSYSPLERHVYPLRSQFNNLNLYCSASSAALFAEIYRTDSLLHFMIADTAAGIVSLNWKPSKPVDNFRIEFTSAIPPQLLGISLDGISGIALDNIPMRGSSGLDFTRISVETATAMAAMLKPGLIMLQFGANIAIDTRISYRGYENSLARQILALNRIFPGTPIIIVGIADMSSKEASGYASLESVEKVRDAQRNAAARLGCAFWDTYQAMGGAGSMAAWAHTSPPLARPDYVHFSYQGAQLIGQMMYNSLMQEYNTFRQNFNTEE